MQDIAGCRVEVENRLEQDRIAEELMTRFPGALYYDRRQKPSHGYRAMHMVVDVLEFPVEVQIRTSLQHAWASATEKLADRFDDLSIKYGGGPERVRKPLNDLSASIADFEELEAEYLEIAPRLGPEYQPGTKEWAARMAVRKAALKSMCENTIMMIAGA